MFFKRQWEDGTALPGAGFGKGGHHFPCAKLSSIKIKGRIKAVNGVVRFL